MASDVISAADEMMIELLAEAAGLPLDKRLAVMQTATRWIAVKNRLNTPEGPSGFDEFRQQLDGAALAPASGGNGTSDGAAGGGAGEIGAPPLGGGGGDSETRSEDALIRRPKAPRKRGPLRSVAAAPAGTNGTTNSYRPGSFAAGSSATSPPTGKA